MSKFDFSCCRIIITLSLYLSIICVDVYSQSSDHNCILNRIFTDSSGSTYQDKIDYYDGLGRLEQSIIGYSHWDTDLITFQEYDSFGRISNQWLPASIQNNGGDYLSPAVIKNRFDALYSDAFPYSKNIYENSPLNRVLEQYGAGQDWHNNNKSVVTTYNTNMSNSDVLNCKLYQVGGSRQKPLLNQNGNYTNGELYVTEVRDENGTMFYEFKDKQDQLVLTRNIIDHTMYDTYYIYDDYSNLCFVLPPRVDDEGYSQANLDKFTFQYRYDERNRCIAKKMPGSDWVYYIYDESDRPIFSQDGEQRRKEQWMFNVFDSSNRVVLTGLCKNIFDYLADPLKTVAVKVTWTGDINVTKGYAITGITLVNPVVLSVNYYNNYSFLGKNGIPVETDSSVSYDTAAESEGFGQRYTASAQGLLTGMLTARLDDSAIPSYDYSVLYYDSYGHLIQTKSNNHLPGGIEKEYVAYNFVGQPIRRKHVHSASGKSTQTEVYSYTYDHTGRLLTTTHQLNDGSPVVLVSNEYDELGRLKSNSRNGLSNLKTVYTYNVRSWVKSITCPLFNVSLYYNDRRPNGTNVSCYNGNISGIDWNVSSDKARGYNFSYDNLSRLTGASYLEGNTPSDKFSTSYSYDKHGNMLNLTRHGNIGTTTYGVIDDLIMSYDGNQLVSVEDKGTNPSLSMSMDFRDGSHESVEYAYDGNGNMVKDLNKGISMIEYNSLNLPRRVTFTGLNNPVNEYVYSAGGKKLSVIHRSSTEKRTDYVGNMIYENGSLKHILVDGGYIENGTYHFYLQDHLGNNRVVAKSDGTVVQTTHYYPYGMSFAEGTFADKQPYKYNGKELDTENGLNLYDYDARQMDATLGRFTSVDPMAEKYYSVSPYVYCGNNPVMLVDVNGKEWGIVLNANGTMTVTLAVNLKTSSYLNLTSSQIGEIKTAISTQLNNTFQEVSGGRISASMSFDGGKDPNRLTPSITLTGGDEMGLGITGFNGDVLLNVHNASDMTEFGETGVHELFHTLNLQDVADTPYLSDTRMTKSSHGYQTTSTTANDIHKNIMNYGSTKIDGKSYKEIYNSRSGMNKITKGQLYFLIKSILKQSSGYGMMPQRKTTETDEEYKQRYNQYYEDYWLYPENM